VLEIPARAKLAEPVDRHASASRNEPTNRNRSGLPKLRKLSSAPAMPSRTAPPGGDPQDADAGHERR
jgi:hypothetical protein